MIVCPDCRMEIGTLETERCSGCGWQKENADGVHVYLSTTDRKNSLLEAYRDNYETMARKNLEESNLDRRYIRYQSMNMADFAPKLSDKHICDLGFGQGFLTRELLTRGASHITAVDISRTYLGEFSRHPGVTAVQANAERLPFAKEFDIVFCSDVMEHVLNLASFLICLNQAIRVGGFACVRVPYRENLMQYSPYVGCSYEFAHLRSFNRDLLQIYFRSAGFSIEHVRQDGFLLDTPREFYTRNQLGRFAYDFFGRVARRLCRDEYETTRWNSHFASLFMRPIELVVLARKLRTIVPKQNGVYELVC